MVLTSTGSTPRRWTSWSASTRTRAWWSPSSSSKYLCLYLYLCCHLDDFMISKFFLQVYVFVFPFVFVFLYFCCNLEGLVISESFLQVGFSFAFAWNELCSNLNEAFSQAPCFLVFVFCICISVFISGTTFVWCCAAALACFRALRSAWGNSYLSSLWLRLLSKLLWWLIECNGDALGPFSLFGVILMLHHLKRKF